MAQTFLNRVVTNLAFYSYALFCLCLYLASAIKSGEFFRKFGEKETLQYAIGM